MLAKLAPLAPRPAFSHALAGASTGWRAGRMAPVRTKLGWWLALLLVLLGGAGTTALGQQAPPECSQDEKYINNWYFGYRAGLDFNQATDSLPPKVLTDGRMTAPGGSGVMSDGLGKLLFYSNGDTVWSSSHTVLPNGTALGGSPFTTDGALAIKVPGSPTTPGGPTRYYLFTQDAQGGPRGLRFSEIVVTGGQAQVTLAAKSQPLAKGTTEKLTAVFHKNGCHIWVIAHGWGNGTSGTANRGDSFLAYRVTETGIDSAVVSTLGVLHAPSNGAQGYRGQMKVSPDGQRLAVARFGGAPGDSSSIELFDFDAATGKVSGQKVLARGAGRYYGVEFSPDRTRLFATVQNPPQLLQFKLDTTNIAASKKALPLKTGANLGSMQAGPNGKIYVARENQSALGVLSFKYIDSLFVNRVTYADEAMSLGGRRSGLGLPNFNQSSLLRAGFGAQSTACLQISFEAGSPVPNPQSYAWTFKDLAGNTLGTSTLEKPVFTFPKPGDYNITIRITNFCFCREVTGTITVPGPPTPGSIGPDQTLCPGDTAAIIASTAPAGAGIGQYSYQWQQSADNATWANIGGATGLSYRPGALGVTTYFRRQVSSGYCGDPTPTTSVKITVLPPLQAGTIAGSPPVCAGTAPAPLTSTAPATGGTGTVTYQWEASPDNATWTPIAGATSEGYAPNALTTTTYFRRRATSGKCGQAYSPSVAITVTPPLRAGTIGANQAICAGTAPAPLTSTLGASGGGGNFTYQWESSADNTTWTAIAGATAEAYAPGVLTAATYFRRHVTASGSTCPDAFSNVVAVQMQPSVTPTITLATPPVQCAGTALTLTPVVTNAGTAPTFRWLVNGTAVASGPTFTSTTLATGDQVQVEVTPTAGLCSTGPATASVTITRTPTPAPTVAIAVQPSTPICPGDALTFSIASITEAGPTPTYQWQVNGADVPGATTPVFTTSTLRNGQTVTVRLGATNTCGQATSVVSKEIAVSVLSPVVVNAGPDKEILEGTSVTLEGQADGRYPVTWTPALGLTVPANDPLHPVAAPLVTTTYTLSAGTGGCAASDQVTVTVRPAVHIPNAFSPNGDGNDDTWQIDNIEDYPDNSVTVFNRWGNKVFSAEHYSRANEWRGDINGQPAPVGTYYYIVVTKGPLGHSYSGSLTIVY